MAFKVPERYRDKSNSTEADGNNGTFTIKGGRIKRPLFVVASDGLGWEHVSVSLPDRAPTWEEMRLIKSLFWGENDLVVQLFPPAREYVNNHPYCLHLWRQCNTNDFMNRPPWQLVGVR